MTLPLISPEVEKYLGSWVPSYPEEMQKMERYAQQINFPILGPVCGHLCYQIARMVNAQSVFEMGSGFGYSTAWFAQAVKENGGHCVHHVVWNKEVSQLAQQHLGTMGLDDVVQFHVAEAVETLSQQSGTFDLIFNDIDKYGYPDSLPIIKKKLRRGGVLIVDNMLWSGRIFDKDDRSLSTEGVRKFAEIFQQDPDWIASLLPVRDGLLMAFKR